MILYYAVELRIDTGTVHIRASKTAEVVAVLALVHIFVYFTPF